MTGYERWTDDELLAATEESHAAFDVLYKRHAPRLLKVLRHALGDVQLAHDLLGEVFLAAWAGRHRYRPGDGSALPWLHGIARHKVADTRASLHLELSTVEAMGVQLRVLSDSSIRELERVIDATDEVCVEALEMLSPAERDVVKARVLEGRGYAEIAAREGISLPTARQRYSRGIRHLRIAVEGRLS